MRWGRHIVAVLVGLCATFLVSTVWLYFANDAQQRQIYLSNRSSAWISYQAQIEQVKLMSLLQSCKTPVGCSLPQLGAQLNVLASRLDLLIDTRDSTYLPNIANYASRLRYFHNLLQEYGRALTGKAAGAADLGALARLAQQVKPLGTMLQNVLSDAVLQTVDRPHGEVPFPLADASLPFILLVLSGGGLMLVLAFELRARNTLLAEIGMLRDSERESQAGTVGLLEALPVPILVMTPESDLGYANEAAKHLAAPPGGPTEVGALAAAINQNFGPIAHGDSAVRDFPIGRGDGSFRHLSVAANTVRLLGENVKVYAITDNTLLRDAELRAMTAGKLAILGELSSAIAHELNQPLAVIKAAAANGKIQAMALVDGGRVVQKFVRIDEQIERARRIIDNVRKLGRPDQPHWAPFFVARSLRSTFGLVSQQYRLSEVGLEVELDLPDDVAVIGDPTLFEIAVLNILMNAREAFARGGAGAAPPMVRVRAGYESGAVAIVISDNAGGIAPQILPQIFDSFVSSKSAEVGTGLGLSIARRAIEGMKGHIEAENAAGGAVFSIQLPALLQEAAA